MNIEIDKPDTKVRAVCVNIKDYQFRFGIFGWPFLEFCTWYKTTIGAIIDNFIAWILYLHYSKTKTHQHVYFRLGCIGIGIGRKLT